MVTLGQNVQLSDDEVSDQESESDQEGNFMAFTTAAEVRKPEIVEKNPSNGNSLRMLTCKRLTTSFARL